MIRLFFIVIALFLIKIPIFSQSGSELSKIAFDFLANLSKESDFQTSAIKIDQTPLAKTASDPFAKNVSVSFLPFDESKKTLVLLFFQEDIAAQKDEFSSLIKKIALANRSFNVKIVFSALDKPPLPKSAVSGTKILGSELEAQDGVFVVALKFGSGKSKLLTGTKNSASPLFLTKLCAESFLRANVPFEIPHTFLSLYRLGILRGEERMGVLIEKKIPAISAELGENWQDFLSVLVEAAPIENDEWDSHYVLSIVGGKNAVFIGERTFILANIILLAICIFLLCGLSFVGKGARRYKLDFLKSSYIVPLVFAFSFFSLIYAQKILNAVEFLSSLETTVQLGFKIAFSFFAMQIFLSFLGLIRLPTAAFVYGYTTSVVAIFSIILFNAIDILWFALFAFEYLIIFIFRPVKRIIFVIISIILLILPYLNYAISILFFADDIILKKIVFCSKLQNLAIVFSIFPIQIFWQKIIFRMEILSGIKGFPNFLTVILIFLLGVFLFFATISASVYFQKKIRAFHKETPVLKIESILEKERENLSASRTRLDFRGLSSSRIKIETKKNAARIEVAVKGSDVSPIYESSYEYETRGDGTAVFVIPDFPPKKMQIDCASSAEDSATVFVTAYFSDENGFWKETQILSENAK